MNSPETHSPTSVLATDVRFTDDAMQVSLSDGREISVPLEWFTRLRDATPEQRSKWRFTRVELAFIGKKSMRILQLQHCCVCDRFAMGFKDKELGGFAKQISELL